MAKTVLVIDDDPTQRRLLSAAVEKAGFACRTAPDGETGVAIATDANAGADVVLLDLTLPGLSGMDALEMLPERRPDLPVVMISGHSTIEMAVAAIRDGAYEFIEKHFKIDRLLLVVERAIAAASLKRENAALRWRANAVDDFDGSSSAVQKLRAALGDHFGEELLND